MRRPGTGRWARTEARQILSTVVRELSAQRAHASLPRAGSVDARRVRSDLHRLARATRAMGLVSFSSIVMRLLERLEPCLRAGELGRAQAEALLRQAEQCQGYLDDPTDVTAAAAMVDALAAEPSPAAGRWERIHLLQAVIEEGAGLAGLGSGAAAAASGTGYDGLTGLLNRNALLERLQELLNVVGAARVTVGVLSIGLSGVEDIVDSLGADVGTAVIARVAARLIRAVPAGGVIGRLATDHFVVVRSGLTEAQLTEEASRLVELIGHSHDIAAQLVSVTARVGLAMAGRHGQRATDLLRNADAALHDARARKLHTTQFFAPYMRQAALRRVSLEAQLRSAIERGDFDLHYQPKLALRTGRLSGLEALLRWRCGPYGHIPPAEFIPVAEQSGLIIPLGEWVIDAACRQMARWREQENFEVPVAVNLSAVQLCSWQTQERIVHALQRHEVPARMLELEITESALTHDAGAASACLDELGRLGVGLAIDDFGTGYSNLSQLIRLPLAAIKIDKSLIAGIATHARDAAIMRSIIDIARTLGARVVAEGVEQPQQRDLLAAAGCDEYQGYLIARPMDAKGVRTWLGRHLGETCVA